MKEITLTSFVTSTEEKYAFRASKKRPADWSFCVCLLPRLSTTVCWVQLLSRFVWKWTEGRCPRVPAWLGFLVSPRVPHEVPVPVRHAVR